VGIGKLIDKNFSREPRHLEKVLFIISRTELDRLSVTEGRAKHGQVHRSTRVCVHMRVYMCIRTYIYMCMCICTDVYVRRQRRFVHVNARA